MTEPKVYYRRDDGRESVRVTSVERTPSGVTRFEIVTPEAHAGRQDGMVHSEFHATYYDPLQTPEEGVEPPRPSSLGTASEWRKYALHLERKLDAIKAPKPKPIYRQPAVGPLRFGGGLAQRQDDPLDV